jgi:hypothetical protein
MSSSPVSEARLPRAPDPLDTLAFEIGSTFIQIQANEKRSAELRAHLEELLGQVRAHLRELSR